MTLGAHVGSVEAISRLRASLQEFMSAADKALCEASIEIDRTADWIAHDQQAHWTAEARKRHEAVVKAQDEVRRAQWTIGEHKPAAIEQKKALRKAEARLAEAKEKLANVARWKREFAQAANEYKGQAQHLASALDADLPQASAALEQILGSIESYLAVRAPEGAAPELAGLEPAASSLAQPVARRRPLEDPDAKASLIESLRRRAERIDRSDVEIIRGLAIDSPLSTPPSALELPEKARQDPAPCRPGDLIIVERPALDRGDGLFFIRAPSAGPADSGWYIGCSSAGAAEPELIGTTASRLVLLRPDWAGMLAAQPGTMLLVRAGEVEMVNSLESDSSP